MPIIHSNAALSQAGRLRVAQFRVVAGNTIRETARVHRVSTTTVVRWSQRYQSIVEQGRQPTAADMVDQSSRPLRSPNQTHDKLVKRIRRIRVNKRVGPAEIAARTGVPAATVHAVLRRHRMNRLADFDRITGQAMREAAQRKKDRQTRYERPAPGDLVHLDIKKVNRIPDGGATRGPDGRPHRGSARRQRSPGQLVNANARRWYLHSAVDDHSRYTYTERLPNETGETAAAFWTRARAHFAQRGVTIKEVMTDNGPCYISNEFKKALGDDVRHLRTRPYRPRTNGKVERFHQTLIHGWVYRQHWTSDNERNAALDDWLHYYNHQRAHTALGRHTPASRIPQNT